MKELYPWLNEVWAGLLGLRTRLPNALLIKGIKGVGKFDLATTYAQSLLCESSVSSGLPCGDCDSCHWFEQGSHPDFRLLQPDILNTTEEGAEKETGKKPSREISVEQIRSLAHFASLSSHRGGHRIVLIHPAEAMNINSANALLKTLEEPTEKLLFILITHKPQQLLPTILSRCLSVGVNTPSRADGIAWLQQQGMLNPENALAQSGFAPLAAIRGTDDGGDELELEILLTALRRPTQMDAMLLADKLQKTAPGVVVHCLQQWCYDLSSVRLTGQVRYFPKEIVPLNKLAIDVPAMRLLRFQKELNIAKREAFHPLNSKLQLESILLTYRQILTSSNA